MTQNPLTPPKTKPARTSGALFAGLPETAQAHDDFVVDVLAIVSSVVTVTPEQAAAAEAEVRARWGGDRPYIARRAGEGQSARNEQIRRDYLRGERLALLERRYALSQRRLWQIIKG